MCGRFVIVVGVLRGGGSVFWMRRRRHERRVAGHAAHGVIQQFPLGNLLACDRLRRQVQRSVERDQEMHQRLDRRRFLLGVQVRQHVRHRRARLHGVRLQEKRPQVVRRYAAPDSRQPRTGPLWQSRMIRRRMTGDAVQLADQHRPVETIISQQNPVDLGGRRCIRRRGSRETGRQRDEGEKGSHRQKWTLSQAGWSLAAGRRGSMGRGFQRLDSNTDFRLETNSRGGRCFAVRSLLAGDPQALGEFQSRGGRQPLRPRIGSLSVMTRATAPVASERSAARRRRTTCA